MDSNRSKAITSAFTVSDRVLCEKLLSSFHCIGEQDTITQCFSKVCGLVCSYLLNFMYYPTE